MLQASSVRPAIGCLVIPIAIVTTVAYWDSIVTLQWYWQSAIVLGYIWLFSSLQGSHEKTLRMADSELQRSPDCLAAMYAKAQSCLNLGDAPQAERLWKTIIERDPAQWQAANNLGSTYLNRGDYLNAAGYYKTALELRETDQLIMENLAQIRGALVSTGRQLDLDGNHAEGLKYGEAVVSLQPEDHLAYAFRGVQHAQLGHYELARADFQKCLDIEPAYGEARRWLDRIGGGPPASSGGSMLGSAGVRTTQWSKGDYIFGHYEIQRIIGQSAHDEVGAMGTIYVCRDRSGERTRDVAIKIINLDTHPGENQDRAKADFALETSRWMELGSHPNLVQLICVEQYEGHPVLIMEHIFGVPGVGTTLRHWLNKKGVLTIDLAARWVGEVCMGLEHVHNKGHLVHCDLKPENLFIDGAGHLKVSDLGIACRIGEPARGGTAPYMAPEQFEIDKTIDQRADIYALGVILFESLCGRRPFVLPERYRDAMPEFKQAEFERMHREETPPDPVSLRPDVDTELVVIILRCMEKVPESRFADTKELRLALSEWAPEHKLE